MFQLGRNTRVTFAQISKLSEFSLKSKHIRISILPAYLQSLKFPFDLFCKAYHANPYILNDEDADVFGKLAEKQGIKVFHDYPEDDEEDAFQISIPFREKKSAFGFHYECKKLAKEGKLDDCIKNLEHTMLVEQKVQPLEINFSVVIGAVARKGDLTKALALFRKLKSYGLTPTAPTYTALFNAFAESKKPELDSLAKIYQKINDKKLVLNRKSFNALLKAYAAHDSLQNCMVVFRDSIAAGYEPDEITFTNLMLSCAKDKKDGSRHALQLFRQMLSLDIKPSGLFLLHFLQVLNNCNIGDISIANEVLLKQRPEKMNSYLRQHIRNFRWLKGQESSPNPVNFVDGDDLPSSDPMVLLGSTVQDTICSKEADIKNASSSKRFEHDEKQHIRSEMAVQHSSEFIINVLDPNTPSDMISIKSCHHPSDRLKLVGGVDNIFKLMKQYKIKPTVKLLTVIASLVDDNQEAEEQFMVKAEKFKGVKLDPDFYNFIMLKRAKTHRHREAKKILERMQSLKILPNYRSWCIHAMSCRYPNQGKQLISNVLKSTIQPDAVLFTTLVHAAYYGSKYSGKKIIGYSNIYYPNYQYLSYLLKQMKKYNVGANYKLLSIIERAAAWPNGYNRWITADLDFEKKMTNFRRHYGIWLRETKCE